MEREPGASGPMVRAIGADGFLIDADRFPAAMLTPERAWAWVPPALADLVEADLAGLLAIEPAPEFLLLGTGARLERPRPALARSLEQRGIGIEAMDSRAAARAWGVLRAEGRWIVAALYPLG